MRLAYYLVHRLGYTNRQARACIASGRLMVDGGPVTSNIFYNGLHEIRLDGQVLKPALAHRYILFYKPVGIETTYNEAVAQSLHTVLPEPYRLPYAGRLDKASEGLLLLTNDGALVESMTSPGSEKEKEYTVTVDKSLSPAFLTTMAGGVKIQGYTTRSCKVIQTGDCIFTIVLTEGRNRQIRRMCYQLGYEVMTLKRVRIDNFVLGDLGPGEWREIPGR